MARTCSRRESNFRVCPCGRSFLAVDESPLCSRCRMAMFEAAGEVVPATVAAAPAVGVVPGPVPTLRPARVEPPPSIVCDTDKRSPTGRRLGVDPTTTDAVYDDDERELLMAVGRYKKASGRKFPTWREVLEIVRSLGYRKVEPQESQG